MEFTHLSLFSGIGGLDLAAEWAGFKTVGQCESADYPARVLTKNWPNVPKWGDIRTLTKETFHERTGRKTVNVISGGFPCQPFSIAGKRGGQTDDRYLWPEMLRVIKELQPDWVVGENVAGFISMGLDTALSDLESAGYAARAFVLPACAVGACHRRDRVAIVANANSHRHTGIERLCENNEKNTERGTGAFRTVTELFDGTDGKTWATKSAFLRKTDGIPHRLDRIRCLGNAVVPQQFYPIFESIMEIERRTNFSKYKG